MIVRLKKAGHSVYVYVYIIAYTVHRDFHKPVKWDILNATITRDDLHTHAAVIE
jgi:hypothetical protein